MTRLRSFLPALLLLTLIAVAIATLVSPPSLLRAQQSSPTPTGTSATRTPTATRRPSLTPTPTEPPLLENVVIRRGGLEVFPLPERRSGRVFAAAVGTFAPHVAGRTEDSAWLYIYYYDRGTLKAGWSPRRGLDLTDQQVAGLPVIDPEDPPELPELEYNALAERPYGGRPARTPTPGAGATATTQPSGGDGNPPPPPPPTPTPTDPSGTQEPSEF